MTKMKILIADDEEMQRDMLRGFLKKKGYEVFAAADGHEALGQFMEHPFQLVLLDHKMPDMTGDDVLSCMKDINPLVRAIMITAHGTVDTAVEVMKLGADDFMEKPVDLLQLLDRIQMIEQELAVSEEAAEITETMTESMNRGELPVRIVGDSSGMKDVLSLARRVAATPWTVLIRGESGTGKELIARLIHMLSGVSMGPFVEVNCGAIPENLFESELFGHEKGAFTGAGTSRQGRFEAARDGTLFLDEIGELPLNLQPKLLRALQEKRVSRVGGDREIPVEVRVVAATNRDIKTLAEEGLFRQDLYYRLNVFDIEIPPLRHHKEDIPDLMAFFLEKYSLRPIIFDPDAMTALMKYPFPGNVRELEHMTQRMVTLLRGNVVRDRDLPPEIRFHKAGEQGNLSNRLESVEREMLVSALEKNGWVQTRAADALGISERVLRYKMRKYNIRKK